MTKDCKRTKLFFYLIYVLPRRIIRLFSPKYWVIKTRYPNVHFNSIPIFDSKIWGGVIEIGKNTIINSNNYGYHINMHSRCKFIADKTDATIIIGENCRIHGTCIHAQSKIHIGDRCLIAANTQIMDSNGHLTSFDSPDLRLTKRDTPIPITIGNDVWIGANCIIMKGSKIGNNSIIQAGSIITPKSNFPDNSLIGGNPATVIKTYRAHD